mmetsp:Transcript_8101/g.20201  ORF Transcript_8101/g.20201 Transcript_8101/m.20201 type:complete len:244 (-) Transcript_8101:1253-1984(-)
MWSNVSPCGESSRWSRSPDRGPRSCSTTQHSPSRAARKIGPSLATTFAASAGLPTIGCNCPPAASICEDAAIRALRASGSAATPRMKISVSRGSCATKCGSASSEGGSAPSPPASSRHAARTSSRRDTFVSSTCSITASLGNGIGPWIAVSGSVMVPDGVCTVISGPPALLPEAAERSAGRCCTTSTASGSHGGSGGNPCCSRQLMICPRSEWFGLRTVSGSSCPVLGEVVCSSSHFEIAALS